MSLPTIRRLTASVLPLALLCACAAERMARWEHAVAQTALGHG